VAELPAAHSTISTHRHCHAFVKSVAQLKTMINGIGQQCPSHPLQFHCDLGGFLRSVRVSVAVAGREGPTLKRFDGSRNHAFGENQMAPKFRDVLSTLSVEQLLNELTALDALPHRGQSFW
jgi:hypothetical protein